MRCRGQPKRWEHENGPAQGGADTIPYAASVCQELKTLLLYEIIVPWGAVDSANHLIQQYFPRGGHGQSSRRLARSGRSNRLHELLLLSTGATGGVSGIISNRIKSRIFTTALALLSLLLLCDRDHSGMNHPCIPLACNLSTHNIQILSARLQNVRRRCGQLIRPQQWPRLELGGVDCDLHVVSGASLIHLPSSFPRYSLRQGAVSATYIHARVAHRLQYMSAVRLA